MAGGAQAGAVSGRRGVFEVDEDAALAELEQAWADGGYHGFCVLEHSVWSTITSLAGLVGDYHVATRWEARGMARAARDGAARGKAELIRRVNALAALWCYRGRTHPLGAIDGVGWPWRRAGGGEPVAVRYPAGLRRQLARPFGYVPALAQARTDAR
jgi:hypothetical protein